MTFGQKLRRLREEKGISQQELSRKLGYKSNGYIFDIEKGDFIPSEDKLKRLAKALGIPFSRMKDILFESKLEDMGIKDPRFIGMFKDYPRLEEKDKDAIARFYLELREAKLGA